MRYVKAYILLSLEHQGLKICEKIKYLLNSSFICTSIFSICYIHKIYIKMLKINSNNILPKNQEFKI
jgi:hypothetical protein